MEVFVYAIMYSLPGDCSETLHSVYLRQDDAEEIFKILMKHSKQPSPRGATTKLIRLTPGLVGERTTLTVMPKLPGRI